MPLCGFNEKMLDGLSLFAEGLFDQAIKRSKEDNLSLEDSLRQEVTEMDIFREILASKGEKVQVLNGITLIAQGMYREGFAKLPDEIKEKFFSGVEKEKDFCTRLDNEYYDNLRPKFGPVKALEELSPWIDKNR